MEEKAESTIEDEIDRAKREQEFLLEKYPYIQLLGEKVILKPTGGSRLYISSGKDDDEEYPLIKIISGFVPEYYAKVTMYGYFDPSEKDLIDLCIVDDQKTLFWLWEKGVNLGKGGFAPGRAGFRAALAAGSLKTVKWMCSSFGWIPIQEEMRTPAINGKLNVLKWIYEIVHITPSKRVFAEVAQYGHFEVLKWMNSIGISSIVGWHIIPELTAKGYIEILKWLEANAKLETIMNSQPVDEALGNGQIETFKWAISKYPKLTEDAILCAVKFNRLDVLRLIYNKDPPPELLEKFKDYLELIYKLPSKPLNIVVACNLAASYGHLEIIKFFDEMEHVIPTFEGANYALDHGHQNVLDWLEARDVFPDEYMRFKDACLKGRVDLMEKLYDRMKIYPDINPNHIMGNGHLEAIKWLLKNKLTREPNRQKIYTTIAQGRSNTRDILQWWMEKHPVPDPFLMKNAIASGQRSVIEWMIGKGYSPTELYANEAADDGHIQILQWFLDDFKILPTVEGANQAAINGHLDILEWLRRKGIVPTAYSKEYLDISIWLEKNGIKAASGIFE